MKNSQNLSVRLSKHEKVRGRISRKFNGTILLTFIPPFLWYQQKFCVLENLTGQQLNWQWRKFREIIWDFVTTPLSQYFLILCSTPPLLCRGVGGPTCFVKRKPPLLKFPIGKSLALMQVHLHIHCAAHICRFQAGQVWNEYRRWPDHCHQYDMWEQMLSSQSRPLQKGKGTVH